MLLRFFPAVVLYGLNNRLFKPIISTGCVSGRPFYSAGLLLTARGISMYTMMQVCREADMTYQTLKFYCNEGLIPNVKRDLNNRRVFDERDVRWIKDLVCLKRCGMSIQEMREYLDLCLEGEGTIPRRKEVLAKKQAALRAQIKELQDSIDYIDFKQQFYDEVLSGKRKYVSNLIKVED